MEPGWIKGALIVLIFEKIIQHAVVSAAFYFNWGEIASTVAVNPVILRSLGILVAALYILSLWGVVSHKGWVKSLLVGLALFDVAGEFIAQGKASIVITVSFIIALAVLVLSLAYHPRGLNAVVRGNPQP